MLFLVLGMGKTGSLVAEVARERGHGVRARHLREHRLGPDRAHAGRRGCGHRLHHPRGRGRKHARRAGARLPHRGRHHRLVRAARRHEGPRAAPWRFPAVRDQFLHRRAKAVPPHGRTWRSSTATSSPSPRRITPPSSTRLPARRSRSSRSSKRPGSRNSHRITARRRRQRRTRCDCDQ